MGEYGICNKSSNGKRRIEWRSSPSSLNHLKRGRTSWKCVAISPKTSPLSFPAVMSFNWATTIWVHWCTIWSTCTILTRTPTVLRLLGLWERMKFNPIFKMPNVAMESCIMMDNSMIPEWFKISSSQPAQRDKMWPIMWKSMTY